MSSDDRRQDLQATFIRHRDRLRAVALQIVGTSELAEDVLQSAYARVVAFSAQPVAAKPYRYCAQIVSQLAIDSRRRESIDSQIPDTESDPAVTHPSPEQAPISLQSLALVQRSLAQLSPRTLRAFTLYRLEGLTHRQIARRLRVPVAQVDLMIRDAVEVLKVCRQQSSDVD